MRAVIGLLVIVALVLLTGRLAGSDSSPVLVAGAAIESSGDPTPTTQTTVPLPIVTVPPNTPATGAVGSTTSSTTPTTQPVGTGSTVTTGQATTTTRPTTTSTVGTATSTTRPPATTTTTRATTTTTSTTTTTTLPPTTTTSTTTTTTLPPTTTTTVALPGVFVHKFDGHDHGDVGEWEAHLKIEIRDEFDDDAAFARVVVVWSGGESGRTALVAEKDGKIDTRLGEFGASGLTFEIVDVQLDGYTYRPGLNEDPASIFIEGPD